MNRDELRKRYDTINRMEQEGYSSREIAEKFGISGARVRYILSHPISERRYNRVGENGNYHYTNNDSYRKDTIDLLGGKCANCGYDEDVRALQIDHVNSDGYKDRGKERGNYYAKIWEAVKAGSKRFQVLCANCNWIKRANNREHSKSKRVR